MNKLLMHTCCAPCSTYVVYKLKKEGFTDLTYFWYNPNIHPYEDYKLRRDWVIKYSDMLKLPSIIVDNYGIKEFTKAVANNPEEPFRCAYCHDDKLEYTARYAAENGYDCFTTTLLVSPYQRHDMIKSIAEKKAKKYGVDFVYYDFREGFRIGQQWAKELRMYMQNHCGCIYSEYENLLDEEQGRSLTIDQLMKNTGVKELTFKDLCN